ncbi:hypothetical protein N0V90_011862 [Kalmusia sp. IMI 367209]|nr:hypothetical protein N0V90_011862 [Kalmusia sp. IMI 367209]
MAQQIAVLHLLLKHFPTPEHINARKSTPPYTSALQGAIVAHNLPGVKALLTAGADLTVQDETSSIMALAIGSAHHCMTKKSPLRRKDVEYDIRASLEIISIIAEASQWEEGFYLDSLIPKFLSESKEIRTIMAKMPHWQRKYHGLDKSLHDIVARHMAPSLSSFPMLFEFTRQLDCILEPLFYAEVRFGIRENDMKLPTAEQRAAYRERVKNILPIIKNITIKALDTLQQSAALEMMLDQCGDDIGDLTSATEEFLESGVSRDLKILTKYARTGLRDDLPMDTYITYPSSLLAWYEDPHNWKQLQLDTDEDRQQIQRYIEQLRQRNDDRNMGKWPLTAFDDDFVEFHFKLLQGGEKLPADICGTIEVESRCICMKPGYHYGDISVAVMVGMNQELEKTLGGEDLSAYKGEALIESLKKVILVTGGYVESLRDAD